MYTPEPAVKVPVLLVIPPRKVTGEFPELFHVDPLAAVIKPVKILVPVAEDITKLPLAPPPTAVVPVTVKLNPAAVKVLPLPTDKLPPIMVAIPVLVLVLPLVLRLLNVVPEDPPIV